MIGVKIQSTAGLRVGDGTPDQVARDLTWGWANWKITRIECSRGSNSTDPEGGNHLGCLNHRQETLWLRKGKADVRSRRGWLGAGSRKTLGVTVISLSLA